MSVLSKHIATRAERTVKEVVEDRNVVQFGKGELSIYETRAQANDFALEFNSFALTAMIQGKKIMHLEGYNSFEYFPDELTIVPSHQKMLIDFPEATASNPTRCIALVIDDLLLKSTIESINEQSPRISVEEDWAVDTEKLHFNASKEILGTLTRLASLGQEQDVLSRTVLSELTLRELIVRLMQSQAQHKVSEYLLGKKNISSKFSAVTHFIKENITEKIDIDKLSSLAYMSKANFFKAFKKEFGITPVELITKERIKLAKKNLLDPSASITDVCYASGFNNLSHFFRLFKKHEGITPKLFKHRIPSS
ncbi:MAG: AraC family transcriptional regulator [Pseudopedobacter saltans]|uniref:AraC family transcriptional regulator n=1 Tax=Pseudopedobacter saltans TaxID=151895 RepID=A0A2W5F3Q7_9SPHI|nr:MAG: AraC family transcriptional regulator [Pseudopedobacter saltans]